MLLFRPTGDDGDIAAAYLDDQAHRLGDCSVRTLAQPGFASSGLAEVIGDLPDAAVCMAADFAAPPGSVLGDGRRGCHRQGAPVVLIGPAAESRTGLGRSTLVYAATARGAHHASSRRRRMGSSAGSGRALLTVLVRHATDLADVPVERVLREVQHLAFRLESQGLDVRSGYSRTAAIPPSRSPIHGADHRSLIAISTRGHRHQVHDVVGDTVLRLIQTATVPILVTRPRDIACHA